MNKLQYLVKQKEGLSPGIGGGSADLGTVVTQGAPERGAVDTKAYMYTDEMSVINYRVIGSKGFDGEKTPGELGVAENVVPQFRHLRFRAYKAKIESDIIKIVCNRFFKWTVGSGLKLQSEPNETILGLEGIKLDQAPFTENVEAYFGLWAKGKRADYSGMRNLHKLAWNCKETSFLGGDCLVVLRLDDNQNVRVQVIDGQHVIQPIMSSNYFKDAKKAGNLIINGIEINEKGEHVAFYVMKMTTKSFIGEVDRIEARGKKSGCLMAWMVYGDKHRIDHHRGIPVITQIIEKVTKLDRYTEAAVSGAEERKKVAWTIEHDRFSDGENPVIANLQRNLIPGNPNQEQTTWEVANLTAKNISSTENKNVYNLPIGAKFHAMDTKQDIQYEPFFLAILKQICAAVDIPMEVALQVYNSNYSASRAAINGWEYIVEIDREKLADDFYRPIFEFWLYCHVLKGKVKAPGFVKALQDGNRDVVEAYCAASFRGKNMPNIDPLKEANAMRVMLGDEIGPLITYEQACEALGNGKWAENLKKLIVERQQLAKVPAAPQPPQPDKEMERASGDKTPG